MLTRTQYDGTFGYHELTVQRTVYIYPHIHAAKQTSPAIDGCLYFHHSLIIYQRIDLGDAALLFGSGIRVRGDNHLVATLYQGEFTFQYRKVHFHALSANDGAERFRSACLVEGLGKEVRHHAVEGGNQRSMLFFIGGEFVLGKALVVTALYSCQLHDVSRYFGGIPHRIALPYQYILQLKFRFVQSILGLRGLVLQAELIQFGKFLPFAHRVTVLHVDVCHYTGGLKTQIRHGTGGYFSVAHQFMFKSSPFQHFHGHFIAFTWQDGCHPFLGLFSLSGIGAGGKQGNGHA